MEDLPLLYEWLHQPHVRRFYQKNALTWAECESKYLPRIRGSDPVESYLACENGLPYGFLQIYRNSDYPDWGQVIGAPHGRSVDYFVAQHGLGKGSQMLAGFPYPDDCYVCHEAANARAIRCSEKAGFDRLRWIYEEDEPCLVLVKRVKAR